MIKVKMINKIAVETIMITSLFLAKNDCSFSIGLIVLLSGLVGVTIGAGFGYGLIGGSTGLEGVGLIFGVGGGSGAGLGAGVGPGYGLSG